MTRAEKLKHTRASMSSSAIEKILPPMSDDVSIFLKKHKANKERFKKEIQFKVR